MSDVLSLADTWTKVSTALTFGVIQSIDNPEAVKYYAVVLTGDPAPTDVSEGKMFTNGCLVKDDPISVDVYCYSVGVSSNFRETRGV